jgi:protein-tyrosine-phosphatase
MAYNIVFVCSGNTCRSPLAEAVARDIFETEDINGFEVSSAGTYAVDGAKASSGTLEVARENGLDLEAFESRRLTSAIIEEADLVLVMEPGHRSGVLGLSPLADTKTYLLGELAGAAGADAVVGDPFGGSIESYRRTFRKIDTLIRDALKPIQALAAGRAEHS